MSVHNAFTFFILVRRDITVRHHDRDKEIVQSNHPYKQYEQEHELSQTNTETKKSNQSINRDVTRKRKEIKNSTIGGF